MVSTLFSSIFVLFVIFTEFLGISDCQSIGTCNDVDGCREQKYLSEAKREVFNLADTVLEDRLNDKLKAYEERIYSLEKEIQNLKQPSPTRTGTEGQEFLFVFPPLFWDKGDVFVVLYISAENPGTCRVSVPLKNITHDLDLQVGNNSVTLPKSLMADQNVIQDLGVYVQSSVNVTLYAMKHDYFSRTTFLVIPDTMYSKNYFITSIQPLPIQEEAKIYNSTISVVSAQDNNLVTFHLNITSGKIKYNNRIYTSGDILAIFLNKFETFVLSHDQDLTGTRVISTAPISVASGNQCGRLYDDNVHACSGMQIMLPPVEFFQKRFIIPFLKTHKHGFNVRVSTAKDMTIIKLFSANETEMNYLTTGGYYDTNVLSNEPFYIETNNDVIVTLLTPGKNNTDGVGTAFMIYVTSIKQYKSFYHFMVPETGLVSHATFIGKNVSNILLDGESITMDIDDDVKTVRTSAEEYEVATVSLISGYHYAEDINQNGFGLYIYGKRLPSLGYGFSVGFDVDLYN